MKNALKHAATTLIGAGEAALMSVGAEMLFDLTWRQRTLVYGVAFMRALFGAFAADAKKSLGTTPPPADPNKTPAGGTRLE